MLNQNVDHAAPAAESTPEPLLVVVEEECCDNTKCCDKSCCGDYDDEDFPMINLMETMEEDAAQTDPACTATIMATPDNDDDDDTLVGGVIGPEESLAVAELVVSSLLDDADDADVEDCNSSQLAWVTSKHEEDSMRAEYVSATFLKATAKVSLGLRLHPNESIITSIEEGSLASFSPLKIGDRIMSINHKDCDHFAPVSDFLDSLTGVVTIIAHNKGGSSDRIECMITKSCVEDIVGLGLIRKTSTTATASNRVCVSKIHSDRIFEHSLLNQGDQVLSINGISCHMSSVMEAITLVRTAPTFVTVVAKIPSTTGIVVAEVAVPTPNDNDGQDHGNGDGSNTNGAKEQKKQKYFQKTMRKLRKTGRKTIRRVQRKVMLMSLSSSATTQA